VSVGVLSMMTAAQTCHVSRRADSGVDVFVATVDVETAEHFEGSFRSLKTALDP
jgi:hypothetical protein